MSYCMENMETFRGHALFQSFFFYTMEVIKRLLQISDQDLHISLFHLKHTYKWLCLYSNVMPLRCSKQCLLDDPRTLVGLGLTLPQNFE